jgi:hypothetical protein
MAATQFEHADQARLALRTIVAEHGPEVLSDPRVLANLLADLLPESPRIARIMVAAAQDKIAEELEQHSSDGMDGETASRLAASSFVGATMFTPDACAWVVAEFSLALGLTTDADQGQTFAASMTAQVMAGHDRATTPTETEPGSRQQQPAGQAQSHFGGRVREQAAATELDVGISTEPYVPDPDNATPISTEPAEAEPSQAEPSQAASPAELGSGEVNPASAGPRSDTPKPDTPKPGFEDGGPGALDPGASGLEAGEPAGDPGGEGPEAGDPGTGGSGGGAGEGAWTGVITADREYFDVVLEQEEIEVESIQFPEDYPERRFELSGERMRIGRRSRSRGIEPEVDLAGPPTDPGISHLHAVLIAQDDGSWSVCDLGSANGTQVNGQEISVTPVPLGDGDRISLGAWTVLTIQSS